ncbi:MAG TPA: hypothetical protein VM580_03245 [Labilithrix sp.]|jgi:hypothetical protein|nr:hypothetical protein [Labilithrix sp.]
MVRFRSVVAVLLVLATGACATYRSQLVHGQRAFDQNDYERSLALLRDLERDMTRLTVPEQAQYAYLRGMSDYRVGDRPDARHWLSIAQAIDSQSTGVLPSDWKARTNETLIELNAIVYADGTSALAKPQATDPDEDAEPQDKEVDAKSSRREKPRGKRSKKNAPADAAPSSTPSSPSD